MAYISTEYIRMGNMSRACIWCASTYKAYVYKFKEIYFKNIGSPMKGGPAGESVIAHLVTKIYPRGS